jgi:DNA-binding transcriptional MerR regulator
VLEVKPPPVSRPAGAGSQKAIRRYAQLVSAGPGNEQERLALLEAHRADVTAKLAEIQDNLELIDHKIDVYRGRLAGGDADQLWAPSRRADAR